MTIIDFDARFTEVLNKWIEENRHRFRRPEDMEDEVPDVYLRWLNTPADWLEGSAPGEYFDRFSDSAQLCELLCGYIKEGVPVPDPLLDRLAELGDEAALMALVKDKTAPCEARMDGIELLRQIESTLPMVDFIRWQVERDDEDDILDNALESLRQMGEGVRGPAKVAFLAAGPEGKEALLDVLADYPGDEDVFRFALEQFKATKDKRALYAGYLAKLDDDHALEALLEAKAAGKIGHIGVTAHEVATFEMALDMDWVETIMFPYNFVELQAADLIRKCAEKGKGFICMKPLAGGAIENAPLAMRFIASNKDITVNIPGMASEDELKQNAAAACDPAPLSEEELKEVQNIRDTLGNQFCRRCNYCQPCTMGINISFCFTINGYLTRYGLKDWAIGRYKGMAVEPNACIECGMCESRCPYHLPIIEMLKDVYSNFQKEMK